MASLTPLIDSMAVPSVSTKPPSVVVEEEVAAAASAEDVADIPAAGVTLVAVDTQAVVGTIVEVEEAMVSLL